MYRVKIAKRAHKYLQKLNADDRFRILYATRRLERNPENRMKRLVGSEYYSFKVGFYRLLIDLRKQVLIVMVIKIEHRKKVYKST